MTNFSASRRILLFAAVLASFALAAAKAPAAGPGEPASVATAPPAPPDPPAIGRDSRIAVFPVQNLSGAPAPFREVADDLRKELAAAGLNVLDGPSLERFMERHRVRYAGGLTRELGRAFRSELGVGAVLVSSVALYGAADPPKIGIAARLVSTGDETAILWAGGVFRAGDESPGLLGLGLVTDPDELRADAVRAIVRSVRGHLSGARKRPDVGETAGAGGGPGYRGKHLPRGSFRHPDVRAVPGSKPAKVAVLPFLDRSGRPFAGELMADHFLREFAGRAGVSVLEPGLVRQALLQSRLIMEGGLSVPQADLLRELLGADYVVTGEVTDYQDPQGHDATPYAAFSTYVIDTGRRQAVWVSSSHNRGDDRVFLFDWGKTYTAGAMVAEMVRAVTDRFLR